MSALARRNGWRGFDNLGTRVRKIDGYPNTGWEYRCDGMPTMAGCGQSIVVTTRWSRIGKKRSGWLVCFGKDFDGSNDEDVVLTFCPSCTAVVERQNT